MGTDKALVPFAGRTLVERAVQILRDAGLAVWIAGARLPLESFAPVVQDASPRVRSAEWYLRGIGGNDGAPGCVSAGGSAADAGLPDCIAGASCGNHGAGGYGFVGEWICAEHFPPWWTGEHCRLCVGNWTRGAEDAFAGFQAAAAGLGESVAVIPQGKWQVVRPGNSGNIRTVCPL